MSDRCGQITGRQRGRGKAVGEAHAALEGHAAGLGERAVTQAKETVNRRVDELGLREASVTTRDEDIIVEVPGEDEKSFENIKDIIRRTARLEFKMVDDEQLAERAKDGKDFFGRVNEDELPVLYLPVGKRIEINVESRDVIHSFWILDFLYKKDMIPAKSNYMYFVPLKEGTYHGKCAELCGEYHSLMLFTVKVVSEAEYQQHMDELKAAGYVGQLGPEYNTNTNLPGNGAGQDSDPADASATEENGK